MATQLVVVWRFFDLIFLVLRKKKKQTNNLHRFVDNFYEKKIVEKRF